MKAIARHTDPLAGKYARHYSAEFDLAKRILEPEGGVLSWSKFDYEAFTYVETQGHVRLVFYPHRTSARNYHIRVRDSGSRDNKRAQRLIVRLDRGSGYNCTFSQKLNLEKNRKAGYCPPNRR